MGLASVNKDKPLGAVSLMSYQKKLEADPRIAATMANAREGEIMPKHSADDRVLVCRENAIVNATTGRQPVKAALDRSCQTNDEVIPRSS